MRRMQTSSAAHLKRAEISVLENPEGIYVASVKGTPDLRAEGSSAQEAESNLIEMLAGRLDSGDVQSGMTIWANSDEVVEEESEV